ncbi:MAG TPA: EAL domain-containing protein [Ilumatobacteraceae bacterium]
MQFGLLSFVLLVAVGAILGQRLQENSRRRTLNEAIHSAQIIATVGIEPLLTPADLQQNFVPLADATRNTLDRALQSSVSDNGVVRIKIWNLQHWIVYSDNPKLVGRWFASEDTLDAAFAGRTVSEITDLSSAEEMEERDFGTLMSVYVPLRVDAKGSFTTASTGAVIGAFEIYLPYKPIAAEIANDTRTLYIELGAGLLVLYLALFRLVAGASRRLRRQATENAFQATHDSLTGLPNRRMLNTEVDALLARQGPDGVVALALLDLDRFKEVNDTLGHAYGDEVLGAVAARLSSYADAACVARLGGDEFVVVVTNVHDGHDALVLCDRIEQLLEEPIEVGGVQLCVRSSIGLTIAPEHGTDCETLLQRADIAMYVAKSSGTTRRMYSSEFDHYSPERLGLAAELRDAMASGQITLAYQPKLEIASCAIRGVEALVRWQHPERGMISPGEFLPVIENTDLIGPLTWCVLDLALAQCAQWRAQGVDLKVAVNLSARTVSDPNLIDNIRVALARHRLPSSSLEIELTESAVLDDQGNAQETLNQLRAMGVSLAVDDFGTGYASIGYLTTLPVDVLKIDMSFVRKLFSDSRAAAVIRFSIDLARHLGLLVVAEGVEDEHTLAELHRLGCDIAQGYLIAKPMPAAELLGWISRWQAAVVSA